MKIFALVPVKRFESSKSRLSSVLNVIERKELSQLLLTNTLSVLTEASTISEIVIVSSDEWAMEIARKNGAEVLRESEDHGVNAAIARADDYSIENGAEATVVIPQDLPLLVAADVNMICRKAESPDRCLVVCPSIRYDGSNALLRKPSRLLKTSYDQDSFNAHIRAATKSGIPIKVFLSKRIMLDLDTTEDLKILMHQQERCEITNLPLDYLKSKLKTMTTL
ncbi:MAG: 2-phospho-L-lactate guanylyltransferase [Candidatus Nitrosopolaris sp.]